MPDLSAEIHNFRQSKPGNDPVHVGITCGSTYPVAISSLGFLTIFRLAAEIPGVIIHRIVPVTSDGSAYPSKTLEENLDIKSLDLILFSCSFELDYLHFARILNQSGIPLLRKDRKALPLIVAGGVALSANPEPLALIADAVGIGEGELLIQKLIDDFIEWRSVMRGPEFTSGRQEIYEAWDRHDGIYVPALWEDKSGSFNSRGGSSVRQSIVENLDEFESYSPIVTPHGVYGSKNLVEVGRGCPTNCRFCLVSFLYKSGRDRSSRAILDSARKYTPDQASVGLISSSLTDNPDIPDIINELAGDGYEVSVSSCKVSSTTPELITALARGKARSITFAPEHGSEKIRGIIGKDYTYEQVRDRMEWAFDAGLKRVKLYFLTGFDEETDDDVLATPEFVKSIAEDLKLYKKNRGKIVIGIASLVPKAVTPFQRRAMQSEKILKAKIKLVENEFRNNRVVEVEKESPRMSILQGQLSIAGREVTEHIEHVARTRGSLPGSWESALREIGDSPKQKVLTPRTSDAKLPWSFIRRS